MLTVTYILQKDKHTFSNGKVQADCVLCCIGDEDIVHMLNRQTRLSQIEKTILEDPVNLVNISHLKQIKG
jgi:hypothetical protein